MPKSCLQIVSKGNGKNYLLVFQAYNKFFLICAFEVDLIVS